MNKIERVIDKYENKLNTLLDDYKKAYAYIRLEHDLYNMKMTNNTLNTEEKKKMDDVKKIDSDIQKLFIDVLDEAGIGRTNINGIDAAKMLEKTKHDTNAFKMSMKNENYSENAAIEREKILQFRILREQIFFGLFLLCFGLSIYATFRDMKKYTGDSNASGNNGESGDNKKSIFDLPKPPMEKKKIGKPKETNKPEPGNPSEGPQSQGSATGSNNNEAKPENPENPENPSKPTS